MGGREPGPVHAAMVVRLDLSERYAMAFVFIVTAAHSREFVRIVRVEFVGAAVHGPLRSRSDMGFVPVGQERSVRSNLILELLYPLLILLEPSRI